MPAWQRMLSGRRLDLLDPSPLDIEIEDIAHGLSRLARWNGQTRGDWAFSVAQHSLLVEAIASRRRSSISPRWQLIALLHDAAEYVMGDLISPFKAAVGADYKVLEASLQRAVHVRFGLPPEPPAELQRLIKRCDHAAAYMEATHLAGYTVREADRALKRPQRPTPSDLAPEPSPPQEAKQAFLARFDRLGRSAGLWS